MSTASAYATIFIILITLCNCIIVFISLLGSPKVAIPAREIEPAQTKKILRKVHFNEEIKFGQQLKQHEPRNSKLQATNQVHVSDVFFAVRTTLKYHKTRLKLALETWLLDVEDNYYIFTDANDLFSQTQMIVTDCPLSKENRFALLCKIYWEFRSYLSMIYEKAWFCHFDDDTFVNVGNLLKLLSSYSSNEHIYLGRSPTEDPVIANAYDTNFEVNDMQGLDDMAFMSMYGDGVLPYRVGFHYATGGAGYCISRQLAIDMKYHIFGANMVHSASSLYLPDDRVIGYVITNLLETPLTNVNTMMSHASPLWEISEVELFDQITLSYKIPDAHSVHSNGVSNMEDFVFYKDVKLYNISTKLNKTYNTINLHKDQITVADDPTMLRNFYKLMKGKRW